MYTNNEKIQISREKSPFSDEREEIIFAGRGNLLEGSNPRSTPAHRFDSNRVPRLRTSAEPKDRALRARHELLRACIRVTIRLHVIEWSSWPSVNEVESRFYEHGRRRRRNCFFREKFLRRRSNERGWNLDMENRFSTKIGINIIVSCSFRLVLIIFLNIFELFRGWILRIIDCWKHVSRICKWDGVFHI